MAEHPPKEPASIQGRSSIGPNPDLQEALNEQGRQRERAAAWVRDKWKVPANCIVCGSNSWTIGDVFELRPFRGGTLFVGPPILPVFPITCNVCGNTVFINAVISGVVKRETEDEDDKTKDDNP